MLSGICAAVGRRVRQSADFLKSAAVQAADSLGVKEISKAIPFDLDMDGGLYPVLKRAFDIAASAGGLVILSPLMGTAAILIKLDSPGPAIYKSRRLGLGGREFVFYKFRSMQLDSEKGGVYSEKGDPRVTRVGRILRASSIDELPQLLNVLKGDMSLIGPRPVLPFHPWPLDQYSSEERRRFEVRPGLTGWAQIHGRKNVEWHQRLKYDVYYVEHLSAALDARIFLETVLQVIQMRDNLCQGGTAPGGASVSENQPEGSEAAAPDWQTEAVGDSGCAAAEADGADSSGLSEAAAPA